MRPSKASRAPRAPKAGRTAKAPAAAASARLPVPAAVVTLGDWLEFAGQLYRRHRVALGQVAADAHDEALYLLLRTLDLPLDTDASVLARPLDAASRARVAEVIARRVLDRVPAAYLTREAFLGEHRFYVDERVIIPRSYFLELIPEQLPAWLPEHGRKVRRVVDVCTGSGCLAVLLAHQFPHAKVDAVDLSSDALDVARINVKAHGLTRRIQLYASDVFAKVPPARYDVILSNPPYEPSALVDRQDPEFAAEPRMAHDGGRDGLEIIRRLLEQAPARLNPDGVVLIEVGGLRPAIDREFGRFEPHWLHTLDGSDCVVIFQAARLSQPRVGLRPPRG